MLPPAYVKRAPSSAPPLPTMCAVHSTEHDSGNETLPVGGLGLSVHGNHQLWAHDPPERPDEHNIQRAETETIPFPRLVSPTRPSFRGFTHVSTLSVTHLIYRAQVEWPASQAVTEGMSRRKYHLLRLANSLLSQSMSSGHIPNLATSNHPRPFTRSAPATPSVKAVYFADKDGVVVFESR